MIALSFRAALHIVRSKPREAEVSQIGEQAAGALITDLEAQMAAMS